MQTGSPLLWRGGALTVVLFTGTHCGSPPPAAQANEAMPAAELVAQEAPSSSEMSTSASFGGLNPERAEASYREAVEHFGPCLDDGATRNTSLAGHIELSVRVDSRGTPLAAWASQSSVGDIDLERCMAEALYRVSWPPSVGGPVATAKGAFDFDLAKGVTPPGIWDAGQVFDTLTELSEPLSGCALRERAMITLYVGAGGRVITGGLSSEGPLDSSQADCVMALVRQAQYPEPDTVPTKVRFRL